ncbi:hypothetical protein [Streptomyces sp. SYSU K217416]
MRTRHVITLAAALLFAVAGCSGEAEPESEPAAASTSADPDVAVEPEPSATETEPAASTPPDPSGGSISTWALWPLASAAQGAEDACRVPSSTTCSEKVQEITTASVVVQGAIDGSDAAAGRDRYPTANKQLTTMRAAEVQYKKKKCAGDPAADAKDSPCRSAARTITEGADKLGRAVETDEAV